MRLTDEHIVPLSLNGTMVLPNSSCDICANVTKKFEQVVARTMYGVLRKKRNYKTRNKKEREKFDTSQTPTVYATATFPRPGILTGAPLSELNPPFQFKVIIGNLEEFKELSKNGPLEIGQKFYWGDFCRLLAKIAHSYLVAIVGLEGYEAYLPDLILGRSAYLSHYVGCVSEATVTMFSYYLTVEVIEVPADMCQYLVVNIHLLGTANMPTYEVVAGKIKDKSILDRFNKKSIE